MVAGRNWRGLKCKRLRYVVFGSMCFWKPRFRKKDKIEIEIEIAMEIEIEIGMLGGGAKLDGVFC